MTARQPTAVDHLFRVLLPAMAIIFLARCSFLTLTELCRLDPTFPGCVPSPSPSPPSTPFPSPSPSPTQSPAPSPTTEPALCDLPGPQNIYWPVEGGAPTLADKVRAAEVSVMEEFSSRFQGRPTADGAAVRLLTPDGELARHQVPGADEARQWFNDAVVARLRAAGYCAMAFGTDQIVVALAPGRVQAFHLLNHGGGDVHYHPPRYEGDLEPRIPEPIPTPSEVCSSAPPLERLRVTASVRPTGQGDVWFGDATPKVRAEFCAPNVFCSPRPEGHPEREACDRLIVGGYGWPRWTLNGVPVEPDAGNRLIVRLPITAAGTLEACAANGVCGSASF